MSISNAPWDYLIVTASNLRQAQAYESQLALRRKLGMLSPFRDVLVVADPDGQRVGSGGSTIFCLMQVINREIAAVPAAVNWTAIESILRRLRILIVHAGGDSRRLPAYGPCGKIFIPVPGCRVSKLEVTLFDRLLPGFVNLPPGQPGAGQLVIAAGDALILLDATNISFAQPGLTALACLATPEHASKHGVFCPDDKGQVRLYLQKPAPEQQARLGAVNAQGQSLLDIGIMSFDACMALALFKAFGVEFNSERKLDWNAHWKTQVLARAVDFYREICCALGTEASAGHHLQETRNSGSRWPEDSLREIFEALAEIPFHLQTVSQCRFLHFGTTRQLITSGTELREYDHELSFHPLTPSPPHPLTVQSSGAAVPPCVSIELNNQLRPGGEIVGASAWIEGCRLRARLTLAGQNVVVGVNVFAPLALPHGACLDILQGQSRRGEAVWFIRCYGIGDTFKDTVAKGATFCGRPLMEWLKLVNAEPSEIWESTIPENHRSLWEARVFPAGKQNEDYRHWLWMFDPISATSEQKKAFLSADRYSAAEIANFADQEYFFARRGSA